MHFGLEGQEMLAEFCKETVCKAATRYIIKGRLRLKLRRIFRDTGFKEVKWLGIVENGGLQYHQC